MDASKFPHLEAALTAIQEAVNIRRQLAEQRPDAFLPDRAQSLGALAFSLRASEKTSEAHAAAAEAIEIFTPYFLQNQRVFRDMMSTLAGLYTQLCEVLHREPDMKLLNPLSPYLTEGETDG